MKFKTSPPIWYLSTSLLHFLIIPAVFKVRVHGMRRGRGPALVVGKHSNSWDVPVMGIRAWWIFREIPRYEMGNFVGYPILGKFIWFFRLLAAFPVMRAKDLIRLKHMTGKSKNELTAIMKEVNAEAAAHRLEVYKRGGVFCYFPEGARNSDAIGRLRSRHEIDEALKLLPESPGFHIQPIIPVFGPKIRFPIPFLRRRTLDVKVLEPISLEGRTTEDLLDELNQLFAEHWSPNPC